nr:phosphatase PAP2 family protein [Vibrio intestinalis]
MNKLIVTSTLIFSSLLPNLAWGSSVDTWDKISDISTYGLVATAALIPTYHRDWQGLKQAGFSIGVASGVGLIGKSLVDKERPDGSDNDSFPSNHTANAFASATTLQQRYGWEVGIPAYGVAILAGIARVEAEEHYYSDVLAGAAIGIASGYFLTDQYQGDFQLMPWATTESFGLSMHYTW